MKLKKNWKVLALFAATGVALVVGQAVMGQTSTDSTSTLDPFNPTVTSTSTPTVVVPTSTRLPVRTPTRVPSRSPFQL